MHVDDSNINPKFKWVNNGEEEPEKFKKIGEDTDDKAIEDEVNKKINRFIRLFIFLAWIKSRTHYPAHRSKFKVKL